MNLPEMLPRSAALLLTMLALSAQAEDVVVIVNIDNTATVDRTLVQQLYTGGARGWSDGAPAFVLDQPEGTALRAEFSTGLLGRSLPNLHAIWAQNIFTGRGLPPKVAPDGAMKRLVAGNRQAIGYIRASELDGTVRAVLRYQGQP